jgi:hypothetical protein
MSGAKLAAQLARELANPVWISRFSEHSIF